MLAGRRRQPIGHQHLDHLRHASGSTTVGALRGLPDCRLVAGRPAADHRAVERDRRHLHRRSLARMELRSHRGIRARQSVAAGGRDGHRSAQPAGKPRRSLPRGLSKAAIPPLPVRKPPTPIWTPPLPPMCIPHPLMPRAPAGEAAGANAPATCERRKDFATPLTFLLLGSGRL
jgi:hypothetical protein